MYELYERLDDLKKQAQKSNRLITTTFLNEMEYALAIKYFKNVCISSTIPLNATKKLIGFNGDVNNNIACMVSHYKNNFIDLRHQDVYGALMKLNLQKEVIGDILILDNMICIYVMKHLVKDIRENLTRINKLNLKFEVSDVNYSHEQQFEELETNVSSERLDSIAAGIMHTSRKIAQEHIKKQNIKINQIINDKLTYNVKVGDIISLRGYGRFIYDGISKSTKKDRLIIKYRRYT